MQSLGYFRRFVRDEIINGHKEKLYELGPPVNVESPSKTFEIEVLRVFAPLISTFDFRHVQTGVHSAEWCVVFENGTTRIDVFFELGVGPWIQMGPLAGPDYDLAFLLQEMGL